MAKLSRPQTTSPDAENRGSPTSVDDRQTGEDNRPETASDDLVTEGQKDDPSTPPALDKDGEGGEITAPGEKIAGEKKVRVKATGPFLVFDPYTLDSVGEEGGEMRETTFVREQIDAKKLERI